MHHASLLTIAAGLFLALPCQGTVHAQRAGEAPLRREATAPGAAHTGDLSGAMETAPLNLLFYGNSLTSWNGTVSDVVGFLALEAGRPAPNIVAKYVPNSTLAFHNSDPEQLEAITGSLDPGETWDWVVLQGQSQEAIVLLSEFLENAVSIVGNVRNHSPEARALLYQTWAYAFGHEVYIGTPPTYADPLTMHGLVESGYAQAAAQIEQAHGPGTAVRATVGEAALLRNFDPVLYDPDLSHPGPQLTVLAALAIFRHMYRVSACGLQPDFAGSSPLVTRLNDLGIGEGTWRELAGIADRVAPTGMRAFPGSDGDLLLRSGEPELVTACGGGSVLPGDPLRLMLESPTGTALSEPWAVFVNWDASPRGGNAHPMFSEVYYDLANPVALMMGSALGSSGMSFDWDVPLELAGAYVLLQGFVVSPSQQTGHVFTTTDAHAWSIGGGPRQRLGGAALPGAR